LASNHRDFKGASHFDPEDHNIFSKESFYQLSLNPRNSAVLDLSRAQVLEALLAVLKIAGPFFLTGSKLIQQKLASTLGKKYRKKPPQRTTFDGRNPTAVDKHIIYLSIYPSSHNHGSLKNGCISNRIVTFQRQGFIHHR